MGNVTCRDCKHIKEGPTKGWWGDDEPKSNNNVQLGCRLGYWEGSYEDQEKHSRNLSMAKTCKNFEKKNTRRP